MAAELIEAGVEPHEVYRRLYEDLPFRRLQLLQRALASVERHDEGAITVAHLVKDDYEETGALETDSEGVVDHMRAVEGTAVAVLVRELLAEDRDGHAQGEPARHRRPRGRVADRPRVRRRRPSAGGRLLHRAALPASWSSACASSSATSSTLGSWTSRASCSAPSRRG